MTTTTDRAAALKAVRAKDSNDKRRRVLQTMKTMETAGQPITAAAVAAAAGVSTWLVYADGIREHLDAARARQRQAVDDAPPLAADPRTGQQPVTAAGLRTDLAVARHEIHRLRTDLDKLRGRLRLQLGAEIEQPDRAELIARVAALEAANRQFLGERDASAVQADTAQRRVEQLEDELTAARESLRRVIRDTNR
jgi:chromosome segregation ATPase